MPAYANGQRYVSKNGRARAGQRTPTPHGATAQPSPHASGDVYGYRLHASVCTATDLPLAWTVATAREHESTFVAGLLDTMRERGSAPDTCALDKGYDNGRVYRECADRECVPTSRSARRRRGAANIARRRATTVSGGSRGADYQRKATSGAARRASASPPPSRSRRTVCTR